MTVLFAVTWTDIQPLVVFACVVGLSWWLLSFITRRNRQAEERLERIGRPKSLAEIDDLAKSQEDQERFARLREVISNLGNAMEPKSDLEKNSVKLKLVHAGFRNESAPAIYQGIRLISLLSGVLIASSFALTRETLGMTNLLIATVIAAVGFFGPSIILSIVASNRQKEIFLTLPDCLDLLVVCVESGLGLDAALRKVTDEMGDHAKTLCNELKLANVQLQMGRARREVLHDLGVRTGVDDMRSLAAILIQADRFGASIAQALRVQSDSMRTKRRQIAEEKAAKTAVQLIFPLVLFIFPAIFVVLVGPAAIQIKKGLLDR